MKMPTMPTASLSTILGAAGFCGGFYLLAIGRIDIKGFGAIAAICGPLMAIPQHPTTGPSIASTSGQAVPVVVETAANPGSTTAT